MSKQRLRIYAAILAFSPLALFSCRQKQKVDLIVHNAVVYTVDSTFTIAEAFAVSGSNIVAVGKSADILDNYEAKEIENINGQPVYPGFIDAHAHFVGYGRSLFEVGLYECKDWAEAVRKVQEFAKQHPNEPWIRGRGWDQNLFPGKQYPTNKELNELFPDRPVLLQRIDGHAAIANEKALAMAGITNKTSLAGGSIEIDKGQPTGLLIDNAVDLVTNIIPIAGRAEYEKWLTKAQANCFAQGLTTIADCGLPWHDVTMIDSLQREGKLSMRLYVMLSDDTSTWKTYSSAREKAFANNDADAQKHYVGNGPYKTDLLFVKGVKAYADGALGSRGACLLKHYADKPGWGGFLLSSRAHFDSLAAMLINTDMQLCTHAIGDSGNRVILDVYAKHLGNKNDKRWRIEHAQVVDPADFVRFGQYSIVPSVQPTHATSDMYWAGDRLGPERIKSAYAYKQLLQQNGWLPLGTDFPVEDISAIKTFYAAVARMDAKGYPTGGFQPENALTREQALRGMTIWAAKACFLENEVGSIEVGKKADFVILDRDLMKEEIGSLPRTKVVRTFGGGKKVH
ncbi:MAG: amidohydrolase [Taibaiella sp.]|nr:amidohydrolase [Taibaiella sp.]